MNNLATLLSATFLDYLRDLEALVNIDCGTHDKAGVDAVVHHMSERLLAFGADITEYPQEKYGNCLYGRWRGKGTARILMIGHTDTVYQEGTAERFPFRRRGGRAFGPGVSDMKSGLLNGLYAVHAILESGFDDFQEIGIFCNSEEEVGSPVSHELYAPLASGANAALILEAARENGAIVSARKGVGTYTITVRGKSAHAGVEPEKGANAILALAQYTQALQALNGLRPGLTVNVGVIRGGTRPNVIADFAQAEVDLRVSSAQDAVAFETAMQDALTGQVVRGVSSEWTGGLKNPPMEKTPATARLAALAQNAARELGFQVEDVATGGGSDGNYTAGLGTPTLDGLGPIGGKAHNAMEEWLDVDSLVPRAAMLAKLLIAIAQSR